ncbi:MAG: hypothetical protein R2860_07145 [Desulfobacterales bacterium]
MMDKDRIELAVRFAGRMRGCSVGAKNTLDKNYLYLAEKQGAEIIPETLVTGVRPWNGGYEILTQKSTGIKHPKNLSSTGCCVQRRCHGNGQIAYEMQTGRISAEIIQSAGKLYSNQL